MSRRSSSNWVQGGGGTWIPNTGWEGGGGSGQTPKKNSAHDLFLSKTVYDGRTISFFEFSHRWQLNLALNLPDSEHMTASKWQTVAWRRNFGLYHLYYFRTRAPSSSLHRDRARQSR